MRNIGRGVMLATATLGVVLSVSACAGGASTPSAGGGPTPTPTPTATSAPQSTGTSGAGGSSSGSGGSTSTSSGSNGSGSNGSGPATSSPGRSGTHPAGSSSSECLSRDLSITDEAGPKPGPGLRHTEYLVFRNTSGQTCTLRGYPGVSFVAGNSGTQVGSAFVRTSGEKPAVRLAPGNRAYAPITITQAPNACSPVTARGFRVYPPDETHSVFVSRPELACTERGQSVGTVAPISTHRAG